ncbi:hypothetical protein [Nocardioides sp.]|uniref:hypothetical protein n=1 Tax=Nocardioides sp. TaxID=35761 RepID=UPI002624C232|nr:hypothetical protein [Nocardioides sp.]MCW2739145.1 hypothetical protein [Nocardioides sp.]
MRTDIDWQHEIDTAFGSGEDLPAAHYVATGRVAVRRRRVTAVVVAAGLAIGGGTAWAAGPGGSWDGSRVASTRTTEPSPTSAVRPPATPPRPDLAQSPDDVRPERADDRPLFDGASTVAALGDGELVVERGWSVDTLIVIRSSPTPARTWGLVTSEDDGPGAQWIYLKWTWGGDFYTISEAPGETAATFGAWLPQQPARENLR